MDNSYIGKIVSGRYEIISLVGIGGMSNVYKAIDIETNKTVAVKFMKPELFENEELVRRFKNESKAISLLNHPNIIKVMDVSITPTEKYIVVEYIDGITLKEYIENRKILSIRETTRFTQTILDAIGYAHENGIIHRDMKPQNVMLLRDGTIRIMDFGIARLSTANQYTVTDKAIGSVHYISPEQVKGKESDARSDIYSIGIMMYEMLTGVLPFTGDSAVNVAMKQVNETPAKPSEAVSSIPQGIEQIVMKALEKNPDDRYQSAREMIADIKQFKENPEIIFPYGFEEEEATQAIIVDKAAKTTKTGKKVKTAKNTGKSKRKFALLPILAILAAATCLLSVLRIFIIFKTSGNALLTHQNNVELPSFVGMTVEEAKSSGYSFRFETEEVYNSDYPAGQVYAQNPRPPKSVKERSTVKLFVSKGAQTKQLDNLAGYTRSEAERYLQEFNVNVNIVSVTDNSVALNRVISTDPEQGTVIERGGTVTLYVSKGNPDNTRTKVSVPSIVGLTKEEASKILAANKLTLGSYSSEYSDSPYGTVIRQTPEAGEKSYAGGRVSIVISEGAMPTPVCYYCHGPHESARHACSVCGELGHEGGEACPGICTLCGEEHSTDAHVCSVCGQTGHEGGCQTPDPDPTPTPGENSGESGGNTGGDTGGDSQPAGE